MQIKEFESALGKPSLVRGSRLMEISVAVPGTARYSLASRSIAAISVSSFLAKQKRTTRWSKPSP
jgi:hypothetical protein